MDTSSSGAQAERSRIEKDISWHEQQILDLKTRLSKIGQKPAQTNGDVLDKPHRFPLTQDEYRRYSRQLIMPEIGIQGQMRLKHSRVLIVGAGGLGCPAAAYLAGAGVNTMGIVDGDIVEEGNLQRQILHRTEGARHAKYKVHSAVDNLRELNPLVQYKAYDEHLTPNNARDIVVSYDVVLDCTDRPSSRYLISDTCVLLQKPLVSASALRTDGQLMTLNHPPARQGDAGGGPCYRCYFPKPPPPESVVGCGEGGILGPVVGVMGVLQALETIKVITQSMDLRSDRVHSKPSHDMNEYSLLIFSAYSNPQFRSVRRKGRRKDCAGCSAKATVNLQSFSSGLLDYEMFCGATLPAEDLLPPESRIDARGLDTLRRDGAKDIRIIDVREKPHFDLASLPGSINVPYSDIASWQSPSDLGEYAKETLQFSDVSKVCFICQRGNDSQLALQKFRNLGLASLESDVQPGPFLADVRGGFRAWIQDVDPDWPDY
ncbi:MAG: Urmylation protein [Alyxoria varia]|nr:MAG: Urmylation protein [Alyxoria varia]